MAEMELVSAQVCWTFKIVILSPIDYIILSLNKFYPFTKQKNKTYQPFSP